MNPQQIDIASFTQQNLSWKGTTELSKLERLSEEIHGQPGNNTSEGEILWSISGSTTQIAGNAGAREVWASLSAQFTAPLHCQRCLTPLAVPMAVEKRYRFVSTEAQAAELDADNDDFDVLVASKQFDFQAILEDELLMALPMAPKHEVCEAAATVTAPVAMDTKPNAFAALAALKTTR